jgi:CRISPR/Cas system-associated endonuclease/helicase Cas3
MTILRMPNYKKRPSAKVVESIKASYEKFMASEMNNEEIRVGFETVDERWKSSWSIRLAEYNNKKYSTDKDDLEKTLAIEIQEYDRVYVAKEGQFKCAYCGKATDDDLKVKKEIIFRTRNSWGKACVIRITNDYCSTTCGSHDQMAHEG